MAALSRYFVVKCVEKIQHHLPSGQARLVQVFMEMLEHDGRVNANALRNALFPVASSEKSANTMLRRLLDNINSAAKTEGISFRVETTADKRAGDQRQIWFEGALEPSTHPHTGDLNRIPHPVRFNDQRGLILGKPVILMTFNEHETRAVFEIFALDTTVLREESRDGYTYTRLGIHGDVEVIHVLSRQGNTASQATAQAAIQSWKPAAIIPLGIAFGINSKTQHVGDVLVSEYVRDYEMARINSDNSATPRGARPHASDMLVDRVRHLKMTRQGSIQWPRIEIGIILCGDKLVDSRPFRDALLSIEPEAIGGEMEAIGVQEAARRAKVDWIVVKAICDWADGGKNSSSKSEDQRLASRNSALVVRELLRTPSLFSFAGANKDDPLPAQPAIRKAGRAVPTAGAMGLADYARVPEILLERKTQGIPTRLDRLHARGDDLNNSLESSGAPVLPHLQEWIADSASPPLFALLGEYGMGKTITCQQLALELDSARKDDPTKPIPLYFDLRHITRLGEHVPSLAESLEECMSRGWIDEGDVGEKYLFDNVHRWIIQGAVLIFDGLDEVLVKLTESDGQIFTNQLLKIIVDARARADEADRTLRLKVLITCRTQYFPTLQSQNNYFTQSERGEFSPEKYRAMILLPWSEEQVRSYLTNALPSMDISTVIAMITSIHNLEELTHRPFTLKLVADFIPEIEHDRSIGRTVYGVTLYRKMAEKWLARDSGKHHIRPEHKHLLAMHLAAHLWENKLSSLSVGDLNGWFHQWLDSEPALRIRYQKLHPEHLEEDLRTATFLARDDKGEESTFRFAHTSLLEFFLANYLLYAIKEKRFHSWAMRVPSSETLEFLGQLLAEADSPILLQTLQSWRKHEVLKINELLLAYSLHARGRGWPVPILHGINLKNAALRGWRIAGSVIAPLELGAANFTGADLRETVLEHVYLAEACFSHALLAGSNFLDCQAEGAMFDFAEISAAIFRKCDLTNSMWEKAKGYRPQWLLCVPELDGWASRILDEPELINPLLPSAIMPKNENGRIEWFATRTDYIGGCAWTLDGSKLLISGQNGAVWVRDAASGEILSLWSADAQGCGECNLSPDGCLLAVAGGSGTVNIFQVTSGELLYQFEGHQGWVNACAWSPDGSKLASCGDDGRVIIWKLSNPFPVKILVEHEEEVSSCRWSPDGRYIASTGKDGKIFIWRVEAGEVAAAIDGHTGGVLGCDWSPDGRILASAGADGMVRLWKTETWKKLRALEGHKDSVTSVAWSPTGVTLASAGADGSIRHWHASSGEVLNVFDGHRGSPHSCTWSPDGGIIASSGNDGSVRLWDIANGEGRLGLMGSEEQTRVCSFSPNGQILATAGERGSVWVFDTVTGQALCELPGKESFINACVWSPDGRMLAVGRDSGSLLVWDAVRWEVLQELAREGGGVSSITWLPDNRRLATADFNGCVTIWNVASGEMISEFYAEDQWLHACAASPNGKVLATAGETGDVRLWDVTSNKLLSQLNAHEEWGTVCLWSSDGLSLVSAGENGVQLWDIKSEATVWEFLKGDINACAWSPDGHIIVAVDDYGSGYCLDAETGEVIRKLVGHVGKISGCSWTADSRLLATAGCDGTVRIWDVRIGVNVQIYGFCSNGIGRQNGYAVWLPCENRLVEATGDSWRYLVWQEVGEDKWPTIYPMEIFGSLPEPQRLLVAPQNS